MPEDILCTMFLFYWTISNNVVTGNFNFLFFSAKQNSVIPRVISLYEVLYTEFQ